MTGVFKGLLCGRESRLQDTVGSRETSEVIPAVSSLGGRVEAGRSGRMLDSYCTQQILI